MSDLNTVDLRPSLAVDFRRVHSVITRGLTIAVGHTQDMIEKHDNEVTSLDGFLDYLRSLTSFLHAHHLTEDELAFPVFQRKKLDAPYAGLMNDHRRMVKILDNLNPHIQDLSESKQDLTVTGHIHMLLQQLYALWDPHIKIEESHFTQNDIDARFTLDEQRQMSARYAEHAMKNSGPDYLVVPFVLYNLSGNDRLVLQRLMPPTVIEQLVPITWKDHWAPMKPFLLD